MFSISDPLPLSIHLPNATFDFHDYSMPISTSTTANPINEPHSADPIISVNALGPTSSSTSPFEPIPDGSVPNLVLVPTAPTPIVDPIIVPEPIIEPVLAVPILEHVPALPPAQVVPLRRSFRPTHKPSYLAFYHCNQVQVPSPATSSTTGTPYPLSSSLSYDKLLPSHRHLCNMISIVVEPKSYGQAILDPRWRDAMAAKIAALEANHTYL